MLNFIAVYATAKIHYKYHLDFCTSCECLKENLSCGAPLKVRKMQILIFILTCHENLYGNKYTILSDSISLSDKQSVLQEGNMCCAINHKALVYMYKM